MTSLNLYGIQVVRKLNECKYCYYIHDSKEDLDKFFGNFFSRQEEYIQTLEAIGTNNINDVDYKESVDKYIAHYDKPMQEFMRYLDVFIMSLFTEMWYDAGELGIKI